MFVGDSDHVDVGNSGGHGCNKQQTIALVLENWLLQVAGQLAVLFLRLFVCVGIHGSGR